MVEFLLRKGANVNEINKVIVLHACQHSSSTLFSTGRENCRGHRYLGFKALKVYAASYLCS